MIGVLTLAGVAILRFVATPFFHEYRETNEQLGIERGLLEREQVLVGDASVYLRQVGGAAERLMEAAPLFLPAAARLQAQSALAVLIERAAKRIPVRITQLEFTDQYPREEPSQRVSVDIQGQGDLEGLLTLIATLEAGPVLLSLDRLHVSTSQPVRGDGLETPPMSEVLTFRTRISGQFLPGAAATYMPVGGTMSVNAPRREAATLTGAIGRITP